MKQVVNDIVGYVKTIKSASHSLDNQLSDVEAMLYLAFDPNILNRIQNDITNRKISHQQAREIAVQEYSDAVNDSGGIGVLGDQSSGDNDAGYDSANWGALGASEEDGIDAELDKKISIQSPPSNPSNGGDNNTGIGGFDGPSGSDTHGSLGATDHSGDDNDSLTGGWGSGSDSDSGTSSSSSSGTGSSGGDNNSGIGGFDGPSGADTHGSLGATDHSGDDNDSLTGGWGSGSDSSSGGSSSGKPVVIDMDGDGVELTTLDQSVTSFDFDDDEFNELTAWTTGDDALLVFDIDNDGKVSQAKEIAFANWTEAEDTDLQALASQFDSNQDRMLDQNDTDWASFKVWQDLDLDGEVDDGEMRTLDESGIKSIGLETRENTEQVLPDGTIIHGLVDIQREDGEIIYGADVAFAYNSLGFRTYSDADGNRVYQFEEGEVQKVKLFSETDTDFNLGGDNTAWIAAEGNTLANTLNASARN